MLSRHVCTRNAENITHCIVVSIRSSLRSTRGQRRQTRRRCLVDIILGCDANTRHRSGVLHEFRSPLSRTERQARCSRMSPMNMFPTFESTLASLHSNEADLWSHFLLHSTPQTASVVQDHGFIASGHSPNMARDKHTSHRVYVESRLRIAIPKLFSIPGTGGSSLA
jgi:hypothetical protein